MTLLPSVIRAEYRGGFSIHVTFSDRAEKPSTFVSGWMVQFSSRSRPRSIFGGFSLTGVPWCGRTGPTSLPRRCITSWLARRSLNKKTEVRRQKSELRALGGLDPKRLLALCLTSVCSRRRRVGEPVCAGSRARAFAAEAPVVRPVRFAGASRRLEGPLTCYPQVRESRTQSGDARTESNRRVVSRAG